MHVQFWINKNVSYDNFVLLVIVGIKACVHVHGVFPYIFIPNSSELLDQDLYQLAASLDKAINVSLGNSTSNSQHVYKIIQVYGR